MNHPDPKKHLSISLIKSALRIIGYVWLGVILCLPTCPPLWAIICVAILVFSELLGIVEELV